MSQYYQSAEEMVSEYNTNKKGFVAKLFHSLSNSEDFSGIDLKAYKDNINFTVDEFKPVSHGDAVAEVTSVFSVVSKGNKTGKIVYFEIKGMVDINLRYIYNDFLYKYIRGNKSSDFGVKVGNSNMYAWDKGAVQVQNALVSVLLAEMWVEELAKRGLVSAGDLYEGINGVKAEMILDAGFYACSVDVNLPNFKMNHVTQFNKFGTELTKVLDRGDVENDVVARTNKVGSRKFKVDLATGVILDSRVLPYDRIVGDIREKIGETLSELSQLEDEPVTETELQKIAPRIKEINNEPKSLERLQRVAQGLSAEKRVQFRLYDDKSLGKVVHVRMKSGEYYLSHGIVYDVKRGNIISDRIGMVNLFDTRQINTYFNNLVNSDDASRSDLYEINYMMFVYIYFSNLRHKMSAESIEAIKTKARMIEDRFLDMRTKHALAQGRAVMRHNYEMSRGRR